MVKMKYPNWVHVSNDFYISEEQMDGTPDFYIERDRRTDTGKMAWFVKWRTSACWSGPYQTKAKAMRSCEQ